MKILIVDDNEVLRKQLVEEFCDEGFDCDSTSSGSDALTMLINESNHYDVAIIDINLPELRGDKVIFKAEKWDINVPIIVITGGASDKTKQKLLHNRIFAYIEKPFTFSDIYQVVKQAVKK